MLNRTVVHVYSNATLKRIDLPYDWAGGKFLRYKTDIFINLHFLVLYPVAVCPCRGAIVIVIKFVIPLSTLLKN